ncbi:tetratricopeptide repeat protein [Sedimentitalea todarodis]|uniref:Tetratricopeptide repeat protein n=1 Tax=Sedimentitalea todarodis TaxID=1631240 RepID=A0ABU3V955_9RHOB|nr:tetratricopeptide repeat protein [Sedimentitalea todarodis]MDU9002711.1 tetratricopeptide repeat protein [Sedimentitalea todarodis]
MQHVTLNNVMSVIHPKFKTTVAAILAIVMYSIPLSAQSADSEDEQALLGALAEADAEEARGLDRQLQRLWSRSGSASMDLLLQRGRDSLEEDDTAAAIEHLTALTDHAPDFAEGWSTRALAYFHAELYGPALSDLERALALNPNNYNAILGLGALLEEFGDKTRAYQAYTRAQAIHPHHEEVTKALDRLRPGIEGEAL